MEKISGDFDYIDNIAQNYVSLPASSSNNGIAKVDAAAADPGNRRDRVGSRGSAVEPRVLEERPGRSRAKAEIPGRGGHAAIL